MGGVVVNDEVKLSCGRHRRIRRLHAYQKDRRKYLVAVALVTAAQNSPGGRIISGKQRKRPVTHIIVWSDARADQDAKRKMGWLRSRA